MAQAQHGATRGPDDRRACTRHGWTDGERALEALLREAATVDWREHELKALPQGAPAEREHERALPRRGGPVARRPGWLSREGATKRTWPLREMPHGGRIDHFGGEGHLQAQEETALGGNSRVEEAF
jgi:hypothetical protein